MTVLGIFDDQLKGSLKNTRDSCTSIAEDLGGSVCVVWRIGTLEVP